MDYRSPSHDAHLAAEETQWARVLSSGDACRGMALVYIQKFCTAVHEFEPAWRAGVLTAEALEHVRRRVLARLDYALAVLQSGGLSAIAGVEELAAIREKIAAATSLEEMIDLTEPIHQVNHVLCEALEG